MLRRDFMPCSHNATLEKREGRFHGVSVNVAVSVLAGMIDSLVKVLLHLVECPRIDGRFIRHNDFYMTADIRVDNLAYSGRLCILSTNQPQIAIALPDADDYGLVTPRTPAALLTSNIGFVYLDRAAQFFRRYSQHRSANPVCKIPRRLIGHFQHALELVRGHSLAGFGKQVGRKKPFPQRQVGIMEDGSGCHTKLVMA